jgi:mono/diheme cytochrome c family protein
LVGLSGDYLSAQLGAWQSGARAAHAPDCMAQVVQRLQPGELAAVSSWLAAQPIPPRVPVANAVLAPPLECGSHQAALAPRAEPAAVPASGGRYLAILGNCQGCHTRPGAPPFSGGLGIPTPFGTVYSSNLTPSASGLARWSADDFWRAMHHGQSRDGRWLNPAFPYTNFRHITRADSDALYAFFKGLEPVEAIPPPHDLRWPFNTQVALQAWRRLYLPRAEPMPQPAAQSAADAQQQRGAYLVQGLGHCSVCHMPRNALGGNADMLSLEGGFIAGQSWYAPSLRDPLDGGVQSRPSAEVRQLLQSGRGGADRTSGPMAEIVRHSLQNWTVQDMDAMVSYLQSLPQPVAAERSKSPAPPRRVLDSGAALYDKHCADCHGAQGQGVRGADGNWAYPPLRDNRTVLQHSPANLLQTVLYGGFGPSTAGNPRPFGMPPYVLTLSEQEVADLLSFVRASWGHQAAPVSAQDVQRLRDGAAR